MQILDRASLIKVTLKFIHVKRVLFLPIYPDNLSGWNAIWPVFYALGIKRAQETVTLDIKTE